MQILFLPKGISIALCFFLWAMFQYLASYICRRAPSRFFSAHSFYFKSHGWELNGAIYEKMFKVHHWKKYLPESGSLIKGSYNKKTLDSFSKESLNKYLVESCRAEMTHFLAIFPFWTFGFFAPPKVIIMMLAYALAVNIPCMIVQRYNRPRVMKILGRN